MTQVLLLKICSINTLITKKYIVELSLEPFSYVIDKLARKDVLKSKLSESMLVNIVNSGHTGNIQCLLINLEDIVCESLLYWKQIKGKHSQHTFTQNKLKFVPEGKNPIY